LSYAYAIRASAAAWTTPLLPAVGAPAYTAAGCSPAPAAEPASSLLLSAASFSVLGGTGGVTSTGATSVSGDLGVSAGQAVVGFPPGEVSGTVHAGDATAAQAHLDLAAAYDDLDGQLATAQFDGDLNGRTFYPGVHHTAAALALTGTLTFDAQGDPDAVFVVQVDAALNTAAASTVLLVNAAQPSNVYWQVEGAAGLGAGSTFVGTILAAGGITLGDSAHLTGRALSYGAVTLAGNTIRFTAALPPVVTIAGGAQAVTKDVTPTIAGSTSAASGTTVTVTVDGQTLTATAGPDGGWAVTAAELAGGTYVVKASVRDDAGNAGSATQSLSVEVNPAPVALLSAASFAVLGGAGGVTSTGATSIKGDVGVSQDQAVVGLTPGMVSGTIHLGDAVAVQAHADRAAAYTNADSRAATREFSGDLNGRTFRAGVHHTAAALALTGIMTLDAEGDPGAVFIIQVDAALDTAASSRVVLTNGALASNVFWQVQGAAGLGASSTFVGTILAAGGITLGDSAELTGRVLSFGAVTLANNTLG
ncbi:MAG: ice-binding family protein, partial [Actinomycetota bacterium]|nr:ice-binding family protein [Actinomycetota bacterium]